MPTTMGSKRKKKSNASISIPTSNGNEVNFTESAMDEFLSKQGLYRKPIAKDGSCLFRAVSEQVHNCQAKHLDVRNQCIQFMRRNRMQFEEGFLIEIDSHMTKGWQWEESTQQQAIMFVEGPFDHHLFNLQNPKEWAGQVEITALSKMFRKDFVVYQDINAPPTKVTDHGYKDKILLCYSNGNHYDIIYGNQYQEHAAMCQSLLFEMLYNKVFAVLDKRECLKKGRMEVNSTPSNQKYIMDLVNGGLMEDREMMDNAGNDDGWTEVKSKARVKLERHSKHNEIEEEEELPINKSQGNNDEKNLWELRRSIDPHLYRNLPLEEWEEDKHAFQQKDMAVAVSLQFKNGEQCSVKLGPPTVANEKRFGAVIKEDYTGSGSILVYVPELNMRRTVSLQIVGSHQSPDYKGLSGHYQKDSSLSCPAAEDGAKDNIKLKKKRTPRSRRSPGKAGDESEYVHDVQPRGKGKLRSRHHSSVRKDERSTKDMKDEEEARFIEEQIKLVELQEKDTTAFPALPVRGCAQVSPSSVPSTVMKLEKKIEMITSPEREVKVPNTEKDTLPAKNTTPAGFWSNFNKKAQKPASKEQISVPSTDIAKRQDSKFGNTLNTNAKSEAQQYEEYEINSESFSENDDFQEKEIDDYKHPFFLDKETAHFDQPQQIKPVKNDFSRDRTVHVCEVKMSESNLIKPLKLFEESPIKQLEENEEGLGKHLQHIEEDRIQEQLLEDDNIEVRSGQGDDQLEEETSMPKGGNNVELSQMEVADLEGSEVQQSNKFSLGKLSNQDQQPPSLEEQTLKAPKPCDMNVLTQERKTVTFAEETKEIPDVPYSQFPKGILIVNGNRPEQGSKTIPTNDHSSLSKENSKQDYMMVHDDLEKDQQMFLTVRTNDSLQSSLPKTQQQQIPPYSFCIPPNLPVNLPPNVHLPTRPSIDSTGADLPQDIPTLRHFFNLGYQTYYQMLTTANQLPFMYMYQAGAMQDPMMQQADQPVVSLPQQQFLGGVIPQNVAFQTHAIQSYPPFNLPQANLERVSLLDCTSHGITQQQVKPQAQIQMPHQQEQLQQQQNQIDWRNNKPGGTGGHFKVPRHNGAARSHRPMTWSQGTGSQRQQYSNSNKQNRKPQSGKIYNDNYFQHFNNSTYVQSISHNVASYCSAAGERHSKALSSVDYCNLYPYATVQPDAPHSTGQ